MARKKTCQGCGIELQSENLLLPGYTTNLENGLCQRCFRLKNYGEYEFVTKSNEEYEKILESVNKTKDLVLYIMDLCNLPEDINYIRKYITNKMILVLNKRDSLPKSINDNKIIEYIKNLGVDYLDIIIISTKNNYNLDLLMKRIKEHKTSKKVYFVGHTNVGKSSLINKLLKNYTESEVELTISPLPSTTLNKITIPVDENLTFIDTPGLVERGNLVNYVTKDELKKIEPKKEIKPKTYQIRKGQCLVVNNIVRIDYVEGEKNSLTFYMSNSLKVRKMNANRQTILKDKYKRSYDVKYREDIVISGLGWIKIVEKGTFDIYIDKDIDIYTRRSLV